jgi:hypothetical protein
MVLALVKPKGLGMVVVGLGMVMVGLDLKHINEIVVDRND